MIDVELRGAADVQRILDQIAPRQGFNIMRSTVHSIAGTIRDDAKREAREDSGTLKKSIKAKRERPRDGFVYSTVRVAPDAFYWRFEEYGQGPDGVEVAMFGKAVALFQADQERIFVEQFVKKFESALARARRRQANGS